MAHLNQAPYEVPVDKEGCSVDDRDENWLKREIGFAEKIYKLIQDNLDGDETSFLASLPDPWEFLDNGETWKRDWKNYVNTSVDKLDSKYPGQKQRYLDYIYAFELFEHNPKDYPEPSKPKFPKEFKTELAALRAFFDCREMKYMQMLSIIYDTIVNEFPHLLDE